MKQVVSGRPMCAGAPSRRWRPAGDNLLHFPFGCRAGRRGSQLRYLRRPPFLNQVGNPVRTRPPRVSRNTRLGRLGVVPSGPDACGVLAEERAPALEGGTRGRALARRRAASTRVGSGPFAEAFRPDRASVRSTLRALHAAQAATQLVQLDVPPCARGRIGSIVKSSTHGREPRYWQVKWSRLATFRLLKATAARGSRSRCWRATTSGTRDRVRAIRMHGHPSMAGRLVQSSHE
jgi:hypothetical protein